MMKIFGSTAKVMLRKLDVRRVFLSREIRHFSTTSIICQDHKSPRTIRIKQEKNRKIEQKSTIPDDHNLKHRSYEQQGQGLGLGSFIRNVFIFILAIFFNPISVMAYTSFLRPEDKNWIPESERKN